MPRSDPEVLASFARSRDERAFEELVTRHLELVLGAAATARARRAGRGSGSERIRHPGPQGQQVADPLLPSRVVEKNGLLRGDAGSVSAEEMKKKVDEAHEILQRRF
jgi:hypothetical protein